jgi:tetratricopeptide (TPR) repeat protein
VPSRITAYRVLIELADELTEERQAFGEVLHEYNALEALPRDVLFIPVGWDPEVELSQRLLRDDYRTVDYFLLVLGDHWPAGSEEEYELAVECRENADMPMRETVPFFKTVSERQLRDPGDELQRVQQFRQRVEFERTTRFDVFSTVDDFKQRLRRHLSRWLVDHEHEHRSPVTLATPVPNDLPDARPTEREWASPPSLDDPDGLNQFGLNIQREGMLKEAETLHLRALELADENDRDDAAAVALGHLGIIYQMQHELDKAESAFSRALDMFETLQKDKGLAAVYSGLGTVYLARNDLDKAQAMFSRALDLEVKLGRVQGKVACWENLAIVADTRGDSATATKLRRRAQSVREEPQYPLGNLFPNDV